jgi:hypothetical protein
LVHARARARHELGPRVFRPHRALGVIIGGAFAAWALVFATLLLSIAIGAEPSFKTFLAWAAAAVLIGLGLIFASWTYSVFSLAYTIGEDTLVIRWGLRRVIIPLDDIQRMVPGRTLDEPRIHGLNWWGCRVGSADVRRLGYTLFYSTHSRPDELLYVVTSQESYALTIEDQALFAEEVQARAGLGPVEAHVQRSLATGLAALPFWRDRAALAAFAISAILCALTVGYVFARYEDLPAVVQLHFPSLGGVVRVGSRAELLRIAYLGAGVLALNTLAGVAVHARERAAGLWLLASGGMIQAVLLAAAIVAIRQA